jgi:hypothetical protein
LSLTSHFTFSMIPPIIHILSFSSTLNLLIPSMDIPLNTEIKTEKSPISPPETR